MQKEFTFKNIEISRISAVLVSTLFLLVALQVVAIKPSLAATVSFDPQETTVGTKTSFLVGVNIDSETAINAVQVVIDMPDSMVVTDFSDGDSVINLWVDRPHINAGGQIVFSGIIPGGFSGRGGRLIVMTVKAKEEGVFKIFLDSSSKILQNLPTAPADSIASLPLTLHVSSGRDNIANILPDATPPEPFVPMLVLLPNGKDNVWSVVFETQDKVSGMKGYQVAESWRFMPSDKAATSLSFHDAESPYILIDQALTSYIYVKATDNQGNVRVEMVAARYPLRWYERPEGYIITIVVVLFAAYVFYINKKRRRRDRKA